MKVKVFALHSFHSIDLDYLRRGLGGAAEFVEDPAEADVLLGGSVGADVLARAKKARLLQVPWTGVETLDFGLLRQSGLKVCNSHSNAPVVAEFTLGLLLSLVKQIPLHDRRLRRGEWLRPRRDGTGEFYPPTVLENATVGFVGWGAIARRLAELLAPLKVRARHVDSRSSPASLEALLAGSDIVVVSVPLTERTRGLVDPRKLKRGAYVVSVSRADVLDEALLYEALRSGHVAGAALDCWHAPPEGLPSKLPFHELENVVLSPHRAGFAAGRLPHLDDAVANIRRLASGRPLRNLVDLEAGY